MRRFLNVAGEPPVLDKRAGRVVQMFADGMEHQT
jgi:hypothetical protein